MYFIKILWRFSIVLIFNADHIKTEPDWTYDLIALNIENNTPDIVYIEANITRPARGIFAFSGYADLKQDITDDFFIECSIYYSAMGTAYFIKTPFFIPKTSFSKCLNTFYKDIIMESFVNCTRNAPRVVDKFVGPLTKRTLYMDNCIISNENFPSKMKSGYYKLVYKYSKQAEGSVELLAKVEQE